MTGYRRYFSGGAGSVMDQKTIDKVLRCRASIDRHRKAMKADVDISNVLIFLIRQAIKNAAATTNATRKTAIEGMVITL